MKQTTLDTYFRKRKNQDSDEISCKRSCSQKQSSDDALLQGNDQIIYGSIRVISEANLSKGCSVSPKDISRQEDQQIFHDNTVFNGSANTSHMLCQASIDDILSSERDQIAHGSTIASKHLEAELSKVCGVSPHDNLGQDKLHVLHDKAVASTSANTAPVFCQRSPKGTFTEKSDHKAHGSTNATSAAELSKDCSVSPHDVLRQKEVQDLQDNTVANTRVKTSPVLAQGSLNGIITKESDYIAQGSAFINEILEDALSKVCGVSPQGVLRKENVQVLHKDTVTSTSANTVPVLCDHIVYGSTNTTSEAELSKDCSVLPRDVLRQKEDLQDNTGANTSVKTSPVLSQVSVDGTLTQKTHQIAHGTVVANVSSNDIIRQEDHQILHDNTFVNGSAKTSHMLCESSSITLGSERDQIAHGSVIASKHSEAELSKVCGVSPNDVVREENDRLLYSNAVASTSADSVWNENAISNTDSESETSMVCEVSPDAVKHIKNSLTPLKSSNKRSNNTSSPRKTSKSAALNSVPVILHTIDLYDKHLRTSGALKGILKDDSLVLLSTWALVTEPAKRIVCYLYCIDHEEQLEMISEEIKTQEIEEIKISLSEKGFITLGSEGSTDQLTLSALNEVCKKLKLKPSSCKMKAKKNLSMYMNTTNIADWFKGSNQADIRKRDSDISEELKSKLKKKWKLSDHARETINELLILMHLDNIFNMGCSLDPTERKNNRPAIKFKPPVITKNYPVNKEMAVDNASIVFKDREEFCRYLEAYAYYKKYKTTKSKCCDVVLDAHKLYTEITRNEESMLRNWTLPMWLRRFTPADLYVDILEDGVSHLKKSQLQKKNKKALEVLDSLISQATFRQHKKAEWYDMKYNIQLKCLRSVTKAASTLKEACEADLPEETVYTLRHRAKQIVDKSRIDQNLLKALRVHADKDILENSIPGPDYFYQQPIKKINSRNRPKYMWEDEPVFAEVFCCNRYKQGDNLNIGGHWEGRVVTTIYFLLFWDIIYTKPLGVSGIFMSHYQLYPLDMWCESFYINRKTWIDNFLTVIEKSTSDEIVERMLKRWKDSAKYDVPDIVRSIGWGHIETVVRLLGPRALAAICRRLAQNYEYTRHGFPDLTLCYTDSIKFREVKTDKDKAHAHQMQWLLYLIKHNIDASICYLRDNPEQQPRENNEISNSEEELDRSQGDRTEEALDNSK